MNDNKETISRLHLELKSALTLIGQSKVPLSDAPDVYKGISGSLGETKSLLERCENIVSTKRQNEKPTIRIIHHFACSGGSLISKCIAAQPNVFLLSELNPLSIAGLRESSAEFTPRDVLTQAFYAGIPKLEIINEKIFESSIEIVNEHVESFGGSLVIRAHSHSDYCSSKSLISRNTVSRILEDKFLVKDMATVRNPIDSYLSLKKRGWVHFYPANFNEYCRRMGVFLEQFPKENILHYEEFTLDPTSLLKKIEDVFLIDTSDLAFETFSIFKVSGDSGRKGDFISTRTREVLDVDYRKEIESSREFQKLCDIYGFEEINIK
ncbi:MAG: hypothetical protein CL600_03525 [Alteromonas sp.]|nr:hypothetical protein [Alteromonas sp.]